MPTTTPPTDPTRLTRPIQPRLLAGASQASGSRRTPGRTATGTASGAASGTQDKTFTATLPFKRPQALPNTQAQAGVPRWAKGVVIGGVLLAVAMPASVLLSRSMLVQQVLTEESSSRAAMVCTAGEARAVNGDSLLGWLFGGSYFSCGNWETREARVQRDRDLTQANYLARERARQQGQ